MSSESPRENRRALKRALITTGALAVIATAVFFHFRDDSEPPINPFPLIPENPVEEARWKAKVDNFQTSTAGLKSERMDPYETNLSVERLAVQGFKPALEEAEEFSVRLPEATALLSDPILSYPFPKKGFSGPYPGITEYKSAYKILNSATAVAIRENRFEDAVSLWEKYGAHRLDTSRTNLALINVLTLVALRGNQQQILIELAYADTSPERIRRLIPLIPEPDPGLMKQAAAMELELLRQSTGMIRAMFESNSDLKRVFAAKPFEFKTLADALSAKWHGMNYLPNATLRRMTESYIHSISSDKYIEANSWAEKNLLRNCGGVSLVEMIKTGVPIVREKITRDASARATLARTALAIRLYELEHGKRPATLAELAPKYLPTIPTDPYDGKPLRYDATKGWLWALGKDLKDNGGDEERDIVRYLPGCEPPDAVSVTDQEKAFAAP